MVSRGLHRFAVFTAVLTFLLLGAGGLVTSHGVGMAVPDWPNTFGYNMFFFPFSQWVGGVFYEHSHRLLASGVGLCTAILALWLHGRNARRFLRAAGLVLLLAGAALLILGSRGRWQDAAVVGLTGIAALASSLVWPRCEPAGPWLRKLGLAAFIGVVLQGILGGLRVVLFKDEIGIFHATLAQLFFVTIVLLAVFTSSRWQQNPVRCLSALRGSSQAAAGERPLSPLTGWLCLASTALILLQLILGATMRHQHAGLAIPDFPLAYGKVWPAIDSQSIAHYNQQRVEVLDANAITAFQIVLQMLHRLAAVGIFAGVLSCVWFCRKQFGGQHSLCRLALVWLGLVLVQVLLGAATIWSNKAADIATAHVLVGALLLALGSILSILIARQTFGANSTARTQAKSRPSGSFAAGSSPALALNK